ncbi:MAG: hypothetical protein PHH26_03315 [Candidatus Thermoplasmatota archaeon]|nr:hypothetical protein [Candidatus Thermoplasmatota archaeon]
MEIPDFMAQFLKLREKELEQKVWEIWLTSYPYMSKDNFVSYEEMLQQVKYPEEKEVLNGVYVDQVGL